jgi:hypothetical protein
LGLPALTLRPAPETLIVAPGVRLPRSGRDITLAAPKRIRKLSIGS